MRHPSILTRPYLLLLVAAVMPGRGLAQEPPANEDEAKVPAYTLPDPLVCNDGVPVKDAATWHSKRWPELFELFQREVYGRVPERSAGFHSRTVEEDPRALGGKATRKQIRLFFTDDETGPGADLLVYLPNEAKGPVPVFLGLNFGGNHTVILDPAVRMTSSWVRNGREGGIQDNKAREEDRGAAASRWPIETILTRGYGVATMYYGDIDPDFDDGFQNGVHPLIDGEIEGERPGDAWGSIGAWAWGLSRALDALGADPAIDTGRVAVLGHSRLGKTSLWAGAQDTRFALVISNDSGEEGAALARRRFGETTQRINTDFPHWFCDNFLKYNDREDDLPVDQHELIALIAPRPVLVLSAQEDSWADPKGEFLSALGADPVYRLLGTDGLAMREMPSVNQPAMSTIGYHMRPGPHDITEADWNVILNFADIHYGKAGEPPSPAPDTAQRRVSIRETGAVGDGRTLDTAAIQRAIELCASAGGGQVVFPPGDYLSGTIALESRVTLVLEAGATLRGTKDLEAYRGYKPPEGTPEARFGSRWHHALIVGDHVEDVGIVGAGTIDGNQVFDPRGEEKMRGPHTILLGESRGLRLEGITIRDSANYAVLLEDCSDVQVKQATFLGGWDGVHFRGWEDRPCRDVSIIDSRFFTGDDAIAGRYWERTLISGCIINSSCNGIRLIGPATGLTIHDSLFYGPGRYPHRTSGRTNMLSGINLQPGGWDRTRGHLDDVLISDVTMRHVASAFHIALKPGNTASEILVERSSASGVYRAASTVESWAEEPFGRVVFRDVSLSYAPSPESTNRPEKVTQPGVDARPVPAWGLYARRVGTLVLEDVRLSPPEGSAEPPAVMAEDVDRLELIQLRAGAGAEAVKLQDVRQVIQDGEAQQRP